MSREILVHPFEALYDSSSKVLILGSFPSVVSREQSFYYANPTNRFWPVMSGLFHEEITDRKEFCLRRHIALWDVIESCSIRGSSDASISDVKVNDFMPLIEKTDISHIYTTGGRAYSLFCRYAVCSVPCTPLPSTSAANARMRLDDLIRAYSVILEELYEEN